MAKITVIDDSKASIDMLAAILRSANHQVTAYLNGSNVELAIASEQPDLILLDIVMPERNGFEILRALRRNGSTKDIPVILVSSKDQTTDIQWGKRQGANDYITKPFSPEGILLAVNQHL